MTATPRLLVIHGAKRNVGDFLIKERGLALLRHLLPDAELVARSRWELLDRETVASVDALVLCGGPALAEDFYPAVHPLLPDLGAIDVPVLGLALGWSGRPMNDRQSFRFTDRSLDALRLLSGSAGVISCRDDLSLDIVTRSGLEDGVMTGCTAWYSTGHLGAPVEPPTSIDRVVVTTPAHWRSTTETIRLLRAVRGRFPDSDVDVVFHRGIGQTDDTKRRVGWASSVLARTARAMGFRAIDAAGDLARIADYGTADLHVGYRVHAHLAFVSQHRPSVLLVEDGRGLGQVLTLGGDPSLIGRSSELVERTMAVVDHEIDAGHPALRQAVAKIEATWPVMRRTVEEFARQLSPA